MSKARELQEEFVSAISGRGSRLLDSFTPLLVFLIFNAVIGVDAAIWVALIVAGLFAVYRIFQKESLVYALGGLGSVVLAAIFVRLSGSGAGFFLPGLISGSVTVMLCVVTVAFNRPLVAWTSFITRRWPLGWYWHPRVLPAYSEVTIFWAVAFAARLGIELWLFNREAINALGVIRLLLGWPFIISLLIFTYLYGLWRLGRLGGPSIEEFKAGKEAPWQSQRRGF